MKQKQLFILCALISIVVIISSCIKKEDKSKEENEWNLPAPTVTNFTPANPKPGETITINGENFSENPEEISVSIITTDQFGFNEKEFIAKLISTSTTSIVCVTPDTLPILGSQEYKIRVNIKNRRNSISNSIPIPIAEPTKGWFYNHIKEMYFDNNPKEIRFASNEIGYILTNKQMVYTTKDGGKIWKPDASFIYNYAISTFDTNHAWIDYGVGLKITSDGGDTWKDTKVDTITTKSLYWWPYGGGFTGIYMSTSTTGLIMKQTGVLCHVNESFHPKDIWPEYQSKYLNMPGVEYVIWEKMSAIDESNLIIAGKIIYSNGLTQRTIIHRKGLSTFNEYEVSIIPFTKEYIKVLQLITKDIAFLVDNDNNIFKLTEGTNWIKLDQKATTLYFKDANTGYIAYNGKILKTTDGGTSWKDEFKLRAGDEIVSITGKDGKMWALGTGPDHSFFLKYNP